MLKRLILLLLLANMAFAQKAVHSHNDYVQSIPFWNAFMAGAKSIEADVILVNNDLMVSHDAKDIKPESTLENLYLKPLSIVYFDKKIKSFDIQILIDFKTEAFSTLSVLVSQLEKYPHLINSGSTNKKINFVISGNRPPPEKYKDYPAYINFDYQTIDTWPQDMSKVALVSLPYYKTSNWKGTEPLSADDNKKIKDIVELVHSKNKKIRFWATPDTKLAWATFSGLGIDFINTDKPGECVKYLKAKKN